MSHPPPISNPPLAEEQEEHGELEEETNKQVTTLEIDDRPQESVRFSFPSVPLPSE